ncbi:MAG: 2-oxo acid dehydrogenase subunit E2, partial [Pseudomonadota bacterium]
MPATIDIRVPDLGDFSEVPVIELAVGPGDTVVEGDTVIVLESDKATLDVPAEAAGKILALKVEEGSIVSTGTAIATLEPAEPSAAEAPAAPPEPSAEAARPDPVAAAEAAPTASATLPLPDHQPGKPVHASPSVRRFARVLGAAIEEVAGSGPKGRITREDVEGFVKAKLTAPTAAPTQESSTAMAGLPPWPQVDHAKFGTVARIPLSRIKMLSGPALARNAMVIPHVTNFEKADVTDLEAFRKSINAQAEGETAKLTMLAFAVKAVVSALRAFPIFISSLDGDGRILKHYFNLGVSADTPEGVVVPVVKDAYK